MKSTPERREIHTVCSCCAETSKQTKVNTHVINRQQVDPAALEETVPGFRMATLAGL